MGISRVFDRHRSFGAGLIIVSLLSLGLSSALLLWTALDRLLLHRLAVRQPDTLVRAAEKHGWVVSRDWFPYSTFEAVRRMHSFQQVAVEGEVNTTVRMSGVVRPVVANMVSGDYFTMLGVRAQVGRIFDQEDDQPHARNVPVVLTHRFWVSHFGGSPSVIGSTLTIQGQPLIVSGVAASSFFGTEIDSAPDLWLPLSAQPLISKKSLNDPETDILLSIIARLQPGMSLARAQAEFAGIDHAIQANLKISDPHQQGILEPVVQGAFALHDPFAHALTLLIWGWVALLGLMCANVAAMLLARAAKQERDAAIRLALGASRLHLVARALRAAAAMGVAGAAGGLILAWFCAPFFLRLLPTGRTPLSVSLSPDARTGVLAICLALLLSLLFGGIPAWLFANVAPERTLRRGTATRRPGLVSRGLLTVQTALALVLLAETGLLLRTFSVLRHTDPGFDAEHLICFTLDPSMAATSTPPPSKLPSILQEQVRELSGVRDASLANAALMRRLGLKTSVALSGMKILPQDFLNTSLESVSSTFFDTMRLPILAGSGFTDSDAARVQPTPVVVNEAFADMLFPNQSPLGRTFGTGATGSVAAPENIVIGVTADSKYRSLREPLLPIYYSPIRQRPDWGTQLYLYVGTQDQPAAVIQQVRGVLARLDAQLPFYEVATMKDEIAGSLWQERLLAVLGTVFSVISIVMAAVGLYGLLAFDLSQRTREFGIRSAVGAQKSDVALLVLRDLLRIVIPGLVTGTALCAFLPRLVAVALYGVRPLDPAVLAAATFLTAAVAIGAAGVPMWRATRVDPAIVLRDE